MKMFCIECGFNIPYEVYEYSLNHFGHPLCRKDQNWIREMANFGKTTHQTIDLYLELKSCGVPAEIEKYDGYKHIDIAIPRHKINIEIDGAHHHHNPNQALQDLKRTFYSYQKGFFTIRIPNPLIENKLDDAVEYILKFLSESLNQQYNKM
jgi:hypothetical protein